MRATGKRGEAMLLNLATLPWCETQDGFALCTLPLSEILLSLGIRDTGLSEQNHQDTEGYFDDWHIYRVGETWGLAKLREQERDYVPGYTDRDYPGVTVSFVAFSPERLEALEPESKPGSVEMEAFLQNFRAVTEYKNQPYAPGLQAYFADPASRGAYVIAEVYLQKLAKLAGEGSLIFPDGLLLPPRRVKLGIEALNRQAGRVICDFAEKSFHISNPQSLTREEALCLLAAHTGNLSKNSFAAEVQFHAQALTAWQRYIPYFGKHKWYASALRADMQVEHDGLIRRAFLSAGYGKNSPALRQQQKYHGKQ